MLWSYELPPERIALYPAEPRHSARLLIYKRGGTIQESIFLHLADFLPEGTLLLYNNSRVIPARLRRERKEILVTELLRGGWEKGSPQIWKALFRPGRYWRRGGELKWEREGVSLQIRWQERVNEREGLFHASWIPEDMPAHSIFERFGEVPLPPYIRRAVEGEDKERYQTFYAQEPGSVAAPTAGLHFTPAVWERLHRKGIQTYPVTLHVGVGTFLPLQNPDAPELHPMHAEPFSIQADTLRALRNTSGPVVCVGTTTLRVVESLYWLGCSFSEGGAATEIPPLIWRERRSLPPWREVLEAVPPVSGSTQLYILPGYPFPITQGLITNFHQPGSTLLGLVEGFIGREGIQEVYSYALSHGFRFLSYGDASLLWRT